MKTRSTGPTISPSSAFAWGQPPLDGISSDGHDRHSVGQRYPRAPGRTPLSVPAPSAGSASPVGTSLQRSCAGRSSSVRAPVGQLSVRAPVGQLSVRAPVGQLSVPAPWAGRGPRHRYPAPPGHDGLMVSAMTVASMRPDGRTARSARPGSGARSARPVRCHRARLDNRNPQIAGRHLLPEGLTEGAHRVLRRVVRRASAAHGAARYGADVDQVRHPPRLVDTASSRCGSAAWVQYSRRSTFI